jgi:uncharacterized RmlC-like cupin family protein
MKSMLTAALTVCCMTGALAQEDTRSQGSTAPIDAKLMTENELVQVFRMSVGARSRTPMHDVSPRVVVWLSDAHFVDDFSDGTRKEEIRKAGDVEWVPARRHAGENLSDKPMEFIAVVVRAASDGGHAPAHR